MTGKWVLPRAIFHDFKAPVASSAFSFPLSLGLPARAGKTESWLSASMNCQPSLESAVRHSPWRIRPSNRVAATSRPCTRLTRRNGYRVSEMRCQL
jgi:hypothetical protein